MYTPTAVSKQRTVALGMDITVPCPHLKKGIYPTLQSFGVSEIVVIVKLSMMIVSVPKCTQK